MKSLRVLTTLSNPVLKTMRDYRKTVILNVVSRNHNSQQISIGDATKSSRGDETVQPRRD
jgi:hypothetical protein